MSCYNCTKKFGLFCGEKGCPDCGFSFCSGCLKFKVSDEGQKGSKNVCGACNKARQNRQQGQRAPPDALEKRLSALAFNPPPPNPITVYMGQSQDSRMGRLKRGLSKEDTAIAERLEQLKKDRKASMDLPSEAEMAERLAKLKGVEYAAAGHSRPAADERALKGVKTDLRPDVVRTDDLVKAVTAEVAIDAKRQRPEDEVAERLARLRGQEYTPPVHHLSSDIDPSKYLSNDDAIGPGSSNPVDGATNIQDLCKVISEISVDAEIQANDAVHGFSQEKDLQEKVANACKKKDGASTNKDTEMEDSEDDEEQEARLIERILAEAKLEEDLLEDLSDEGEVPQPSRSGTGPPAAVTRPKGPTIKTAADSGEGHFDEEELPWCVICNEDAALRCHGCEGDLYCQRCLRECHDEYEIKDHRFVPFKNKKKGAGSMH